MAIERRERLKVLAHQLVDDLMRSWRATSHELDEFEKNSRRRGWTTVELDRHAMLIRRRAETARLAHRAQSVRLAINRWETTLEDAEILLAELRQSTDAPYLHQPVAGASHEMAS